VRYVKSLLIPQLAEGRDVHYWHYFTPQTRARPTAVLTPDRIERSEMSANDPKRTFRRPLTYGTPLRDII
ncbi:MAG: hypothetical protein WCC43_20590, partial [Pseudolabrys sp.]